MRRFALALLILLILLAGYVGVRNLRPGEREGGPPAGPCAEAPAEGTGRGIDLPPGAASEKSPPSGAGRETGPEGTGKEEPRPGGGEAPAREEETGTKPAFRPNPRTPPPPKPGVRSGGGSRPPIRPTGLWERFPPEIPRGRAAIRVVVRDREGRAFPGVDVYVGPPEAAGRAAVSFGDLRKIGRTDENGIVRAGRLPEGSAAVAGNVGNLLCGRRGLDARSAVTVVLKADREVEAELTLPFSLSELGAVEGRVLDAEGRPLRGVQAAAGFLVERTDRSGRFRMSYVPAGTREITFSRYGYVPVSKTVEVTAGKTAAVEAVLDFREKGSLLLRGTVVGPAGERVPGAVVYLMVKEGRGGSTIRSAETDGDGRFEMRSLPDRLRDARVRIQASRAGYRARVLDLPEGLAESEVEIALPVRQVRLKLLVIDAATGEPLTRCRFEARREGRREAGFSKRGPEGRYETWLDPGSHDFLIEAPAHEPLSVTVDVGPGGGTFEYTARLRAEGGETAEVVLAVLVVAGETGDPLERARVEVISPEHGTTLAGLEGERPGGRFVLPVPAGTWRLRVTAQDRVPYEDTIRLDPEAKEAEVRVVLPLR